jgi:hypothetical protein
MVAKGAMPPLVLTWTTAAATYERRCLRLGVEFTQEPVERYGSVDAGFRDPSGNGWKMIQALSIAFTLAVIANFVAMATGPGAPPPWITYAPLLPLALLLFTGLYLFVQPYLGRRQGARGSARAH